MLTDLLLSIEQSGVASALRGSRWVYPLVNAGHIASIGLLIGSIVPYDLRVLGLFANRVPLATARLLLVPVAASGLMLAIIFGALLFSVKATDYAANPVFRVKLALILLGSANIVWIGLRPQRQRLAATFSLLVWLTTLIAGRMIAFV